MIAVQGVAVVWVQEVIHDYPTLKCELVYKRRLTLFSEGVMHYTQFRPVSVEVGRGKLCSSVILHSNAFPAPNLYANGTKWGV